MLFIIRARDNVKVKDDYVLAEWELHGLFGQVHNAPPENENWRKFSQSLTELKAHILTDKQGDKDAKIYWCEQPKVNITDLFHRLTYAQQVAVYNDNEQSRQLAEAHYSIRWCSKILESKSNTILIFVPLFCILELCEAVSKSSNQAATRNLEEIIGGLLSHGNEKFPASRFTGKRTSTHLAHGAHIYKAKFFPRVARTIANGLLPDTNGRLLLDPFVGSGTSQLEASALGMHSIGLDMDPLCAEMTRTKLDLIETGQIGDSEQLDDFRQAFVTGRASQLPIIASGAKQHSLPIPEFLKHRLPSDVADELVSQGALIASAIQAAQVSPRVKAILRIAFSDALSRKVRFRFHGLGHGRFAVELGKKPLLNLFRDQLTSLHRTLYMYEFLRNRLPFPSQTTAITMRGDARAIPLEAEIVDLVITSPPYIPASSGRENYAKTRALSFLALNIATEQEVDTLDRNLTGSMNRKLDNPDINLPNQAIEFVRWLSNDPHRSLKAKPTEAYFSDLRQALVQCWRVLKPGSRCVFIVAKSNTFYTYKTREIARAFDNESVTAELGQQAGFRLQQIIHNRLDKLNPVARPRARDEYFESIIVFEKP